MVVAADGEGILDFRGQDEAVDGVVVDKMHMGTGLVVDAGGRLHAIGLRDELVQGKPQQIGLSRPIIIHERGLSIVGVQIKILVQLVDFARKHGQLLRGADCGRELRRVHFHVQYLRA